MTVYIHIELVCRQCPIASAGEKTTHNITDIIGDFKLAIGASTLGMDDTLWDSLSIKVCKQVDQGEVLEQERSIATNPQRGLGVHDLGRCFVNTARHDEAVGKRFIN